MATPESAPSGGRFSASGSITARNDISACNDPYAQARTIQLSLGTVPGSTHIYPTRLTKVRGWAKSEILCYNVHNIQMGTQMAKLAML
jgi:hypothetical protein